MVDLSRSADLAGPELSFASNCSPMAVHLSAKVRYSHRSKSSISKLIGMYVHTNALQRKAILVYLGNVDFISLFHLSTRVAIVHLMQRSWASEEAWQCGIELERLQLEILRTYHEVATMDVQQRPSKRSLEFRARTALS